MPQPHQLRILGSPALVSPTGQDLGLPLGKPFAALCFVTLESSRVTRDDLATVLWPGVPRDRARASVRQALWLVRKVAGGEIIEERDGRLLPAASVETDLERLKRHLAAGRLEEAWSAWRGGPLRGFSVPDAPRWNCWADRFKGAWERRFGEALEVRAAAEDGEARIAWLRRALEVRPHRESVHAALVEAFIHQHRVEDAEAAIHEARRVVDDPTPGLLEDLAERLRALRKGAFNDASGDLCCEFVGRAAEFSELTTLWRSTLSGRSRAAAILGPAGIGKTRLAEQFVELAELEGARVVDAKGMDTEIAIDLGAVALLAKQLLHLPGAAGISSGSSQALRALVPSEDRNGDPPVPSAGTAGLGDALSDLVTAVAQEAPLILRVEDVHWIDGSSLALLLRLIRNLCRMPVLLLMTCRTEERDTSALRSLRRLDENGGITLIGLGPLTRAEVAEMLGLMFTFPDARAVDGCAERLHRVSGGNPLFLMELLHHLRAHGLVMEEEGDGDWPARTLRLPETLELPRTVREALGRRIAGLGQDARAVAVTLARSKTPLSATDLARRARMGETLFTAALGELLQREVVRWTRNDLLEVAHDSLRAGLREGEAAPRGGRRSRLLRLAWLPAVAATAALLFLTVKKPGAASPEAPFGGGLLISDLGDRQVVFRLRTGTDGPQLEATDTLRMPAGLSFSGAPVRSPDGGWILPAIGVEGPDQAPDAWVVKGGEPRQVLASPGDDRLADVGPGNGQVLVGTEDAVAPHFRMTLVRLDMESGATRLLASGTGTGDWARDGSLIAVSIAQSPWDSVAILRPDGARLHALAVPDRRLAGMSWCDGRGVVLGVSRPDGGTAWAWSWRPGDGSPVPLDLRYPPLKALECSPDGRVVAYLGWVDGAQTLVMEEIDGSGTWLFPEIDGLQRFHWVASETSAAPRGVAIEPDSLVLVRGERRVLSAVVEGDPDLPPERGAWQSSDPLTVFVSAEGGLVGNGPGVAVVRYVVDGWLSDSVRVRVEPDGAAPDVLFSDPLAGLDEGRWRIEGFPPPAPVLDEQGQGVLEMDGDGRFWDGIVSRESFDLSDGVAAEVDFRLPLTRTDRQQFRFCLLRGDPLPIGSRPTLDWRIDEQLCFQWPAFELEDFDAGLAHFMLQGSTLGAVAVAGALRDGEWNRVSIQLQADGRASLLLNERPIVTAPQRVELAGKLWHIALNGRGVDTRLQVRNLVLWARPRYDAAEGGP